MESRARGILLVVAVLFAIGEALDSIDVGVPAIIFAILFAVGAVLMRRRVRGAVVFVGALVVLEVAAWPTFKRENALDWVVQVPFLIVGLIGLAALAWMLFERRSRAATGGVG